jgi:DnaJ-class molecular chaperone
MTPYAVLRVRPLDSDEVIRRAFHKLAAQHHPDKQPGPTASSLAEWYAIAVAYSTVKTADRRAKLAGLMESLSGLCSTCRGSGVRGTRVGRAQITLCDACGGDGRVASTHRKDQRHATTR